MIRVEVRPRIWRLEVERAEQDARHLLLAEAAAEQSQSELTELEAQMTANSLQNAKTEVNPARTEGSFVPVGFFSSYSVSISNSWTSRGRGFGPHPAVDWPPLRGR